MPIERLFAAREDDLLSDLMDADPPSVSPRHAQEAVAWRMIQHGENSMAVVDKGRFLGLIPPHAMLTVLLAEHDEDLARLGGCTGRRSAAMDGRMESETRPGGPAPAPIRTLPDEPQPAPSPRPTVDEVSESSFPASDPPSEWTWETGGRFDNA